MRMSAAMRRDNEEKKWKGVEEIREKQVGPGKMKEK